MPQVAGGGGYAGKRTKNALNQLAHDQAVANSAAGLRERVNGGATAEDVHQMGLMRDLADKDITPMTVLHGVADFPGKVYNDADQMVRGLIDIPRQLWRGADPGDMAYEMAQGQLDAWTHPVEYANEHPLGFMLDAAGALGGLGALDRAAFSGRMLPEGPQSIGAVGRRLDEGKIPSVEDLQVEGHAALGGDSASDPIHLSEWNSSVSPTPLEYVGKPDPFELQTYSPFKQRMRYQQPQALVEQMASDLNRAAGEPVQMPGMARAEFPVPDPDMNFEGYVNSPGTLMEYLDNLKKIEGKEDLNYANPEVVSNMRGLNILDQVIGNSDRSMGANMHALGRGDELVPVALDQGYGFPVEAPQTGVDSFVDMNVWPQDTMGLGPAGETRGLLGSELEAIEAMRWQLQNPTPAISQYINTYGDWPIQAAIRRAERMLQERRIPAQRYT